MKLRALLLPILGALALVFAVGCSTTPEAQKSRYKKTIDELELKANKLPHAKLDILKKVKEFNEEFEKAGDDIEALRGLNSRVEKYLAEVEKMTDPTGTGTAPATGAKPVGGKIGASPTAPPVGTQAPGGKLGGTTGGTPPPMGGTPPPMGGTPPPSGGNNGGFGGK